MKVAFFTEIGSHMGTIFPRTYDNMRVDVAWAVALKAPVFPLDVDLNSNTQSQGNFDIGIIIVPKNNPNRAYKCREVNLNRCKIWATMQEANHTYWQNGTVLEQVGYLNFLNDCDVIFCHNEGDKKYYSGLLCDKKVEVLQSILIEDALPKEITKPEHRFGVMIGGNWTEWYSGQDSFFIAQEFKEKIYAPSMGRKQSTEDDISDLTHVPYLKWTEWMFELSKRKYAVHLMRTYAAGTFALNCARLGIPCIGWNYTDTQRLCFPELSFIEGDMESARKAAAHLHDNQLFYNHCSHYAKKACADVFAEGVFVNRFNSYF